MQRTEHAGIVWRRLARTERPPRWSHEPGRSTGHHCGDPGVRMMTVSVVQSSRRHPKTSVQTRRVAGRDDIPAAVLSTCAAGTGAEELVPAFSATPRRSPNPAAASESSDAIIAGARRVATENSRCRRAPSRAPPSNRPRTTCLGRRENGKPRLRRPASSRGAGRTLSMTSWSQVPTPHGNLEPIAEQDNNRRPITAAAPQPRVASITASSVPEVVAGRAPTTSSTSGCARALGRAVPLRTAPRASSRRAGRR